MNRKAITALSACLSLLLVLACDTTGTRAQTNNIETFYNSKVPGIRIQFNATSETQPANSITFNLSLTPDGTAKIGIASMEFVIYGFVNGTDKIQIYANSSRNFELKVAKIYSDSFYVPEQVCGVAYGEITLTYNVNVTVESPIPTTTTYVFQDIVLGFTMTRIENVYLKSIEEQLANMRGVLDELNQTFRNCFGKNLTMDELLSLNQTFWQFKQEYESLKGVKSELDNVRTAMVFLAVVAVFFVATTAYLVLRKPKSYW